MLIDAATDACFAFLHIHSLCNAVREGAFKPVSEHNELKFSLNKGEITKVIFTSRQLINLFT